MNTITIAFDVDWTLIGTDTKDQISQNKRVINGLKFFKSCKNTKIIVWSGRWEEWARFITTDLWIEQYVDGYASKNHKGKDKDGKHIFEPDFTPDIAIDDIQACDLWLMNLIVREK